MKSKSEIRERVWSQLQDKKVARFPGAEGRIPNFIGAEACARVLSQIKVWQQAKALKVNPDSPQRAIRQKALEEGKIIFMAVPRLHSDKPFIELDPRRLKCSPYVASSIKGAGKFGRAVTLKEVRKIDLIVCGSVAVNRQGARVGKGGGYSDLEFALLTEEKKIDRNTPIVTSVHSLQIVNEEIPMTEHDIPLNAIATPNELIQIELPLPRPNGIYWDLLPPEKIEAIPVLKNRRKHLPLDERSQLADTKGISKLIRNDGEGVGLIDNTGEGLLPFPGVKAELLLRERHQLDGKSFVEMRVWRVPRSVRASGHEFKYSLAYVVEGECVLRYDNEAGKGDHIHWTDEDRSYNFPTPEKLLADFWLDVDTWRTK